MRVLRSSLTSALSLFTILASRLRRRLAQSFACAFCMVLLPVLAGSQRPARAQPKQFGLIGLDAAPTEVVGGRVFTLNLRVNHEPDRRPGLAVGLSSGDLSVAPFERRVFVLNPLSLFAVSGLPTRPVPVDTLVVLRAVTVGRTREATLLVLAPRVKSLSIDSESMTSGELATGRVTLTGAAPPVGLAVDLASTDPAILTVPSSVVVPPGEAQAEFPVVAGGVVTTESVHLVATLLDSEADAIVEVDRARLEMFAVEPDSVIGGEEAICVVTLAGVAPPGGAAVDIAVSGDSGAVVVPEVVVPEGARQAVFQIDTTAVDVENVVLFEAQVAEHGGGGRSQQDRLRVTPAMIASLDLSPGVVRGGRDVRARVSLIGPAGPGGLLVALRSSNRDAAVVPPSVQLLEGERVTEFTVRTAWVVSRQEAVIGARAGGASAEADLVIERPVRGDWDDDGDRDLADALALKACFIGPGKPAIMPCAAVFDADDDTDVDLADVLGLQRADSGPTDTPTLIRVAVDPDFDAPHPPLPDPNGGAPRPVAALTDLSGTPAYFVQDEVRVRTDDPAVLAAFLARWDGEVVRTFDPEKFGLDGPPTHLARIATRLTDTSRMSADLQAIHPNVRSELRFANAAGMDLVAAAARERREGLTVDLNWVFTPTDIPGGWTREAPNGSDLDGDAGPDSYSRDAFRWWTHTSIFAGTGASQMPDWPVYPHQVSGAWQYLNRVGVDTSRVRVAFIDGGFMANDPDMPADQIARSTDGSNPLGTQNPAQCGGNPCPWHGTGVVQTAAATIDDDLGTAGTGGQVIQPITIHTPLDSDSVLLAVAMAQNDGARVINMSFGNRIPAASVAFSETLNDATASAASAQVVLIAAAGNGGEDVDEEDCFGGSFCWEAAWHSPCENEGVICVGGLAHGGIYLHPSSNYGSEEVDIFAPFRVNSGARPANPNGSVGTRFTGTSAAAPYVAGVAAMMFAARPLFQAADLTNALIDTCMESSHGRVGERVINAGWAVHRAIGDLPPEIEIVSPVNGAVIDGFNAQLRAEATDFEDDNLTVEWSTLAGGAFGTGFVITAPDLTPGLHVIIASVTDSDGQTVSDSITVTRADSPASTEIVEPLDGSQFVAGETIAFRGLSFDFDDFQQGPLPDARLSWTAFNITTAQSVGTIGVGHESTASFGQQGDYRIGFLADNASGPSTGHAIQIKIGPTPADLPPTVEITSPPGDTSFDAPNNDGKVVALRGTATDPEDGALGGASMVWRSSIDGFLGTGSPFFAKLSANPCGLNEHVITLTVADSAGNVRSRIRRISVARPPC